MATSAHKKINFHRCSILTITSIQEHNTPHMLMHKLRPKNESKEKERDRNEEKKKLRQTGMKKYTMNICYLP